MQDLNISFIQSSIHWEDKKTNLDYFGSLMNQVAKDTDIILLPEMFNTGFSMEATRLGETMEGTTVSWMKSQAIDKKMTIIGSLIVTEDNQNFNRLIVASPDGTILTYDKRHLFRMAGENKTFTPGEDYIIFDLKGWKIRPFVCYDLRFPVWGRNKFNDQWEYDLAIYVANWPASRTLPWKTLPVARAIENQCYVATLNRVGIDAKGLEYHGNSQLINSYGEVIMDLDQQEYVITQTISKSKLDKHRNDFPVGYDADPFTIL
ncbi:MAG: amidohydrolase [Saprospiraceae bacterium]